MYKIGFINENVFRKEAVKLTEIFESKGISSELIPLETEHPLDLTDKNHGTRVEKDLTEHTIDIGLLHLPWIPPGHTGDISIGALIARRSPADCLIFRPGFRDKANPMQLKSGTRIGIDDQRRQVLLYDLRPGLTTEKITGSLASRLELLQKAKIDAIFCLELELPQIQAQFQEASSFIFDAREFVPYPATGVIACQYRKEDDEISKVLTAIHDRDLGHSSNVERQILRELVSSGGITGAYCRVDDYGHFHTVAVYAASSEAPLQYARVSASTYKGMPEAILAQFDIPQPGQ